MLSVLRAEVNVLLAKTPVRRKPALRRADAQGALLATDLPHAADDTATADFIARAELSAWQVSRAENGWLLLDKPVPAPQTTIPALAEGECGCCISLLARHPEDGTAAEMIRECVRAEEAGKQTFERFCGSLHARLAAMLRQHQPLPGALLPYLAHAYRNLSDRRE